MQLGTETGNKAENGTVICKRCLIDSARMLKDAHCSSRTWLSHSQTFQPCNVVCRLKNINDNKIENQDGTKTNPISNRLGIIRGWIQLVWWRQYGDTL